MIQIRLHYNGYHIIMYLINSSIFNFKINESIISIYYVVLSNKFFTFLNIFVLDHRSPSPDQVRGGQRWAGRDRARHTPRTPQHRCSPQGSRSPRQSPRPADQMLKCHWSSLNILPALMKQLSWV